MREIYFTSEDENPKTHLKRLEKLKAKAQKSDVLIDRTLDKLIRKQKITSEMAASLANDSHNVAQITKKLIETAELLYIESDTFLQLAEENETIEEEDSKMEKEIEPK